MDIVKKSSKPVVILFSTLILVCLTLNSDQSFEDSLLLLVLNTLFLGIIPFTIAFLSARTYIYSGITRAMLISCGMIVFGLGSIIAACARFLPDSGNYTVTMHNLCACLFSVFNLVAAVADKVSQNPDRPQRRKFRLSILHLAICCYMLSIVIGIITGIIPVFFRSDGPSRTRNIVLTVTQALCLGAAITFYTQSRQKHLDYLYGYSIALLLITMGIFAVFFQKAVGSPLCWVGRICQYLGCVFALISIGGIVVKAKKQGLPSSRIMTEFFIDAETNYKILVENLSCAILNVNEDLHVFFSNSVANRLFKYSESEFQETDFVEYLIAEPYRSLLRDDAKQFRSTGKSELVGKTLYWEAIDGDGRVFPVEISFSYCVLSTGYAQTFIIRDITEQLDQRRQLMIQAEELKKKNKLITDFFTNISHEFKTPLTIIMNAIEMSEMRLSGVEFAYKDRVIKNLSIMRQNAHRLLRLIANLLDVTKLDAGFLQVNLMPINIKDWMRKLVESVVDFAARRDIRVELVDRLEIQIMPTDGEILDRIMLNLLSNAIKHTDKGGRISVTMHENNDQISICVRDDGEGIPDDKKDLIFDRFRQVNTSMTRNSEGSGIGLALCKSLVELLHGTIRFESILGEGTSFFVELPILDNPERTIKPIMHGLKLSRKVEMEFSDIL